MRSKSKSSLTGDERNSRATRAIKSRWIFWSSTYVKSMPRRRNPQPREARWTFSDWITSLEAGGPSSHQQRRYGDTSDFRPRRRDERPHFHGGPSGDGMEIHAAPTELEKRLKVMLFQAVQGLKFDVQSSGGFGIFLPAPENAELSR